MEEKGTFFYSDAPRPGRNGTTCLLEAHLNAERVARNASILAQHSPPLALDTVETALSGNLTIVVRPAEAGAGAKRPRSPSGPSAAYSPQLSPPLSCLDSKCKGCVLYQTAHWVQASSRAAKLEYATNSLSTEIRKLDKHRKAALAERDTHCAHWFNMANGKVCSRCSATKKG